MTEMAIGALTVHAGYHSDFSFKDIHTLKMSLLEKLSFGLILLSLQFSLKVLSEFLHISCRPARFFPAALQLHYEMSQNIYDLDRNDNWISTEKVWMQLFKNSHN